MSEGSAGGEENQINCGEGKSKIIVLLGNRGRKSWGASHPVKGRTAGYSCLSLLAAWWASKCISLNWSTKTCLESGNGWKIYGNAEEIEAAKEKKNHQENRVYYFFFVVVNRFDSRAMSRRGGIPARLMVTKRATEGRNGKRSYKKYKVNEIVN